MSTLEIIQCSMVKNHNEYLDLHRKIKRKSVTVINRKQRRQRVLIDGDL